MSSHKYYEELGALAAVGELSAEELAALKSHLLECELCSKVYAQFSHVVREELPALHKEAASWRDRIGRLFARNGYKERFLEKATAHGFRFSPEVATRWSVWSGFEFGSFALKYAFIAAFAVVLVSLVVVSRELQRARSTSSAGIEEVQRQLSEFEQERDRVNEELKGQAHVIANLRSQLAEAKATAQGSSDRAAVAAAADARLQGALDAELAKSSDLGSQLHDRDRRLADLNLQLDRLGGASAADKVAIASLQHDLEEMREELRAQRELLDREHGLLAANRDIRDLMGARNLHIIDVFDTDTKGKSRKAFGRVFYTEGKSLIFYAFDLNGTKVQNAKHSFQAWGERDGQNSSARSLGIFFVDDAAQRRWVLKIDDPRVLSQIDSVFVTVEPFGGAEKPSGQKLLYAFLKNPANHP